MILVDKTGPIKVVLWQEAVEDYMRAQIRINDMIYLESFQVMDTKKNDWNGSILTPLRFIQSVGSMKNRKATIIKKINVTSSPFMRKDVQFRKPDSRVCIYSFESVQEDLHGSFRGSFAGTVCDVQEEDETQTGQCKRLFNLVDSTGSWLQCCALGRHTKSKFLEAQMQIILYNGTGRAPVGNTSGLLYAMKDAVIVPYGKQEKACVKRLQIMIGEEDDRR